MKSVVVGSTIAIVIAIVAGVWLTNIDQTAGQKFSTDNVRLGDK